MKNIRPLYSETDYDWALEEIEKYFINEPKLGSPDAARFDVLGIAILANRSCRPDRNFTI